MNQQPSLRERLRVRNKSLPTTPESIKVSSGGELSEDTVTAMDNLAAAAQSGSVDSRDQLYRHLESRLHRACWVMKPWPNNSRYTGVWERDDVLQEGWIVFHDLLTTWPGDTSFFPWLMARFAWRVRDRILRGIGKPQYQLGDTRVPIYLASEWESQDLLAQPERVLLLAESLNRGTVINLTEWKRRQLAAHTDTSPLSQGDIAS